MTDEQCTAIIEAVKDLTNAVHEVGAEISSHMGYCDIDVVDELRAITKAIKYK